MFKNHLVFSLLFISSSYGQYVTENKILKNKKSFQLTSCQNMKCILRTQKELDEYNYITTVENEKYVTYIVNVNDSEITSIKNNLKNKFPNMILKSNIPLNTELEVLKGYDKDFNTNKNQKTSVKIKSLDLYYKPTTKSKVIAKKKEKDILYTDGCNEYNWCKEQNKNRYFLLNDVTIIKKDSYSTISNNTFIEKYKQSLEFFKEKKYEKSYLLLEELFNIKSNDLNINFYLGRSAYEIKKYDEAISAYERFLFEKPNNFRVKLEMARSLFMTKSFKEANKLFLEVKKDPNIPKASLVIVDYYLQLIDKSISKHFFNGVIMLGVVYDSNIGNQEESSLREFFKEFLGSTYDPNADIQVNDDSAWYNQEIAVLNYQYKLSNNKEIKQDFLVFNKDSFNSAHDDTKVTLLSYTPGLIIKHNPKLTINYALYTDFLKYAGEDKLKTIALYPQFNYLYNKTNTLTGYVKYQKKSDLQDSTKDSNYKKVSSSLKHIYNKTLSSTSNITIANEKAKDEKQTSIDFSSIKGSFSLNFKYKPTLFFTPSLSYTITKYDDIDSSYLIKPENKQLKIALSATYVYSPQWILQGTTDFTTQNSNIAPNEYDKYTFGINLIRPF